MSECSPRGKPERFKEKNNMNEEQAVAALRRREPEALRFFLRRYGAYVGAVVANIVRPQLTAQDAEEIVADVFWALWDAPERLREGKVRGLLGIIARNKAYSALRRRKLPTAPEEDLLQVESPSAETLWDEQERRRRVQRAVEALPEPEREIFLRHYFYGQKTARIAEEMALGADSVRQRLHRGRARLKQMLETEGEF